MEKTRSKPTSRQQTGRWGEQAAAGYLEKAGYAIIGRNVRTPYGEIDLIAVKESRLAFVEVKTRTGMQFGFPEQAVTGKKLEHMISAAESFLSEHAEYHAIAWQLDVIAIRRDTRLSLAEKGGVEFEHFENITS